MVSPLCYGTDPLLGILGLDELTRDKSLAYLQAVAFGLHRGQAGEDAVVGLGVVVPPGPVGGALVLGETLDTATAAYLNNSRSPGRK